MQFFPRFYSGLSFVTHWRPNWPLQNLASVCCSGENMYQKLTKFQLFFKKFFKNLFSEWFSWRVTLTRPPLFFNARHFLSWAAKVKSQPFWRKSKKSLKIVKNDEIFQKFDFHHPRSDWLPKRAHLCLIFDLLWKKKFFSYKKWDWIN